MLFLHKSLLSLFLLTVQPSDDRCEGSVCCPPCSLLLGKPSWHEQVGSVMVREARVLMSKPSLSSSYTLPSLFSTNTPYHELVSIIPVVPLYFSVSLSGSYSILFLLFFFSENRPLSAMGSDKLDLQDCLEHGRTAKVKLPFRYTERWHGQRPS